MSRSEKIRFQILRILRNSPMHGYQLYTILTESQIGLVKNPSELYKIINKMAKDGDLDSRKISSQKGPDKKVYSLTSIGEKHYMDLAFESASVFMELLTEFTLHSIIQMLSTMIEVQLGNLDQLSEQKIFLDLSSLPPKIQNIVLMRICIQYADKNTIYTRSNVIHVKELKARENIHFLTQEMQIAPNILDFYFKFHIIPEISKKHLHLLMKTVPNLLKPTGICLIFLPLNLVNQQPYFLMKSLREWFQENFNSEYLKKAAHLFPIMRSVSKESYFPTEDELKLLFTPYFKNIHIISKHRIRMFFLTHPVQE